MASAPLAALDDLRRHRWFCSITIAVPNEDQERRIRNVDNGGISTSSRIAALSSSIAPSTATTALLSRCDMRFDWTARRTRAVVMLLKKETTTMSRRTLQTTSRRRRRTAYPQFLYVITFAGGPARRRRASRDEGPAGPQRPRPRPAWHVRPLARPSPRPAVESAQQAVPRILVREDA